MGGIHWKCELMARTFFQSKYATEVLGPLTPNWTLCKNWGTRYLTPWDSVAIIVTSDVKQQYKIYSSFKKLIFSLRPLSKGINIVQPQHNTVTSKTNLFRCVFTPTFSSMKALSSVSDTTTVFPCFPASPLHLQSIYWATSQTRKYIESD